MGGYYGDMDTFMIDEGILNKLVTFGSYDGRNNQVCYQNGQ